MYRVNKFAALAVSIVAVVSLSFGLEAVMSQTLPNELAPEAGAEGPVGSVGVPVEINGVARELQIGDEIATGSVVTNFNHFDLLEQTLKALDPNTETETVVN